MPDRFPAGAGAAALLLIFSLWTTPAEGAEIDPTLCTSSTPTAIVVEWDGQTWYLTSEECRELFASDPERYGQLFEALAEIDVPAAPRQASLVPS